MFNYEHVGNIHIHTINSDGSLSYEGIARRAQKAGLDFICFNDHDYMLSNLSLCQEMLYGKMAVMVGLEIGRSDHHYLAYDVKRLISKDNLTPQQVIDEVSKQNGFGFMAHPFEKGMPFYEKSVAYTWKDLSVKGFTGICIWNFSSRWKERVKTLFHGIFCLIFKTQTLKGPSRKTLEFWDSLCQERRVAAVGGSDAHGTRFKKGFFNLCLLPYDFLVSSINIHVFLKKRIFRDYEAAKSDVYDAMKEGRLFIANDRLANARGFRFLFISDDGSDLLMGEEDEFRSTGSLVVELPSQGEIRLIKDGMLIEKWQGTEAVYQVKKKGVYRVEVYKKLRLFGWRPWIYTNPVYLR